ncbi:MAG: NAD(P)/FAD-dependent oxidoreductase [Halioglobus sp.]|nr:NAD(P)/FAD-dependent oxidoreductase [Halioglobus sp.]
MQSLAKLLRVAANLLFHLFLAAYWYLVHSLYPEYALFGAIITYVLYLAIRPRLTLPLPPPLLVLLAALLFFLMLNPPPSLVGLPQLFWLAGSALLFRVCFAALSNRKLQAGALLVSYILFLALPLGIPRLGPTQPSVSDGETLDVVIVGAGFGGMAMGKELLDAGLTNFRIYEAAPEVGGTWWHNRYPGLHVDVPSSLYSFSYFPNPYWSRLWAPRNELLEYSIAAADELGVRPFIHTNTWVQGVRFDDESGLWQVALGEQQVKTRHLVLATGGLHIPNTPVFDGAASYTGTTFHSARWRDDVELDGKRVAIVGSGASAVQIIPEIAQVAAQVDMYQRTPNWISPQDNREVSSLRQFIYAYVPLAYKLQRLRTHAFSELAFRVVFPLESQQRARVEDALKGYIRNTVKDQELAEKLIPDYEFGCKRPLVTGHYIPSMNRPNVDVITEGLARLTPQGIRSRAGVERDYDVIIMATGYRVAALPFAIEGPGGLSLEEIWQDKPEAYETMMVHGFPNLYFMSGPNSGLFGSIIVHIESASGYVAQLIRRMGAAQLIEPRLDAQLSYNRALQAELQKTVWAGSCKSWYKMEDGHIIANHPDPISRIVYERSRPRWDDFIISQRN